MWTLVYFTTSFFPFTGTTGRSEGLNILFKMFVHLHDSVPNREAISKILHKENNSNETPGYGGVVVVAAEGGVVYGILAPAGDRAGGDGVLAAASDSVLAAAAGYRVLATGNNGTGEDLDNT
ncbi:hypothetical protein E2562_025146 [Oryza meyeriana var. granulata]|uniref:Uncharacterized protein n=1 Tax=Oryza meyeriana var. granulata TaxID=110450 RepID=A0A6G1E223_9ORYZ|nr:hypothetical protein E2562_025146 [Oryza meyeriana var. granulata]